MGDNEGSPDRQGMNPPAGGGERRAPPDVRGERRRAQMRVRARAEEQRMNPYGGRAEGGDGPGRRREVARRRLLIVDQSDPNEIPIRTAGETLNLKNNIDFLGAKLQNGQELNDELLGVLRSAIEMVEYLDRAERQQKVNYLIEAINTFRRYPGRHDDLQEELEKLDRMRGAGAD